MNIITTEFIEQVENYCSGKMDINEKLKFEKSIQNSEFLFKNFIEYKELFQYLTLQQKQENLKKYISKSNKSTYLIKKQFLKFRYNIYKNKVALLSIATVFVFSIMVAYLFNILFTHSNQLVELKRTFTHSIINLEKKINTTNDIKFDNIGTGFLINNDGYILTNSHVLNGSKNIYVENVEGKTFNTKLIIKDNSIDIALLKIIDSNFILKENIPFNLSDKNVDLGESIFTLGYPKEDIVYSEGYLSSLTGYNSDSNALQMNISLNPGNSGGPIFDKHGNVIGIVKNKQKEVDGVYFAIKSNVIISAIKKFKEENKEYELKKIKIKNNFTDLNYNNKIERIKKYKKFIYIVKSNS